MTWTVLVLDAVCGHCLAAISAGAPVCLLGIPQRPRCEACAARHGFYPDLQEISAARARIADHVAERQRREQASAQAGATQRPLARRITPPRPPTPFPRLGSILPFDARAAAAGDREDR